MACVQGGQNSPDFKADICPLPLFLLARFPCPQWWRRSRTCGEAEEERRLRRRRRRRRRRRDYLSDPRPRPRVRPCVRPILIQLSWRFGSHQVQLTRRP